MRCNWMIAAVSTGFLLMACGGCSLDGGRIDPRADKAIKSMSDTLDATGAFSFHVVGAMDKVAKTGQLAQFSRDTRVSVRRPGGLFADTKGDDVSRSVWYDRNTVTVLDKRAKEYAAIKAPATIEEMLDFVMDEYGLTLPVADLLFQKTYASMIARVQSGTYVGRHSVGEHACHHLAFRQDGIDWQIWIDAGKTSVPRKLVIVFKDEPGQPQYAATIDEWKLSAALSDDLFVFRSQGDAKKVEIAEILGVEEGE
jgi:hypothetical protein